jgi:hypothetical protein
MSNQTKNTRDELKKIIMGWRHKVHRVEVDVIEGKISRRKWDMLLMSDADKLDEEINKGLADDIEKLLDQTKQETIQACRDALPEKKPEYVKQIVGRDLFDVPAHNYNEAITTARSAFNKLKDRSN